MDLKDSEFETLLREEFEPRHPRPLPESPSGPRSRRYAVWGGAAIAAAVLVAVLIPARLLPSAPAVLEDTKGSRKIQYGDLVWPSEARTRLAMADGSHIEMRARSELSLERADDGGVRILLNKGSIIVDAAGQRSGNLHVRTKNMTAFVAGAVCYVKAEDQGSRVAAISGEVRVQQGPTEKSLQPGDQLFTNPLMVFIPLREEISWSRDAAAYAALLQQSAVTPLPAPPSPGPRSDEGRALIDAAVEGHPETVRRLLDRGADPNGSVPGQGSPLIAAAREGHADVVTLLLDRGANIDDVVPGDENALITASREGRLDVVRLLVSRGANVNAKAWSGPTSPRSPGEWRTPLNQARRKRREEVVQFLLSAGARE